MSCIRNCDGTIWQPSASLQTYDPNNPEHALFNSYDAEIIQFGGSPIWYFGVFIQPQTIDPLYREDRGKMWSTNPVQLYGLYEPVAPQNYLNMFGIDSADEIQIQFNYQQLLQTIGHPPKIGSRLLTPQKNENWVIIQRNVGDFFLWGELRLTVIAQRFQESTTTGEGRISQPRNPPGINAASTIPPATPACPTKQPCDGTEF